MNETNKFTFALLMCHTSWLSLTFFFYCFECVCGGFRKKEKK